MEENDLQNLDSSDEKNALRELKSESKEVVEQINDGIKQDVELIEIPSDEPPAEPLLKEEVKVTEAEAETVTDVAKQENIEESPDSPDMKPAKKIRAKKNTIEETATESEIPSEVIQPVSENEILADPADIAKEKPARKPRIKKPLPDEIVSGDELPVETIAEPVAEQEQNPVAEELSNPVAETAKRKLVKKVKTEETSSENAIADGKLQTEEVIESLDQTKALLKEIEKEQEQKIEAHYETMSREELTVILEEAVRDKDINDIKAEVALVKVAYYQKEKEEKEAALAKFIEDGGVKEDYSFQEDSVGIRFTTALNIYKEKRIRFNEDLENQKQANLELKLKILEDLKHLVESDEELKKTYDAFKTLQERWKEIGLVPKTEINNLWQNYNFLVEKFFDKVKINRELKELDLKKNLEAKIELCEKAEELLLETSVIKTFRQLQKYHEMWRDIGPVMQDKKDEIWERFRNATEKINERRREHYDKLHEEQETILETKTALCEKAEQIAEMTLNSIREWQDQTTVLDDMLKSWKSISTLPRKVNDELWNRFKTAIDTFYANKKEYFGKLKDEQVTNYNQKLNLCLQAEAIKNSQDWKRTAEELIRLQQEWKKIGSVPKKYSDKIWLRFRAASDEFFTARSAYFNNIDSKEEENLKQKEELLNQVKEYAFGSDNNENLQIIKDFQRKWMEIGHVPMKFKNTIHDEFREAINAHLDKLKLGSIEKITIGFKSKFENIAQSPGASQAISKERSFITGKISELKNDIKLWENNIGFLANSRNATLLKDEFLKKIEKTKQDIIVLEEKLKFLKDVR